MIRNRIFGLSGLIAVLLFGFAARAAEVEQGAAVRHQPVIADAPTLPPVGGETPAVPASGFFPIVPFDTDTDSDSDVPPQLLPVASNQPLGGRHSNIRRAIITIQDVSRDANGAVAMLTALAGPRNNTTLIIAPQFMLASDIARFKGHLPNGGRTLASWPMGAWEDGGQSLARAPQKSISSFTAIDLLLLYLVDKKIFPALRNIVVAGHGAGGSFAMRYAAMGQAQDIIDPKKTSLRFVAANASSYLYFTSMRPIVGKAGFTLPDAKACPGYNDYRYGLHHLNSYGQRTGADEIRLRYSTRRVIILAGQKAGAQDGFPDTNCAALLQGANPFTRAANYDVYLNTIFSGEVTDTQNFVALPDAGYDPVAVFDTPCGMKVLFGDGICPPSATRTESSQ